MGRPKLRAQCNDVGFSNVPLEVVLCILRDVYYDVTPPDTYGEWIDNPDRVKREFYNHFANRFSAPDWSRVPMEGIFPKRLDADSSHDLEGYISNDEIKKAVWDFGEDVSNAVKEFFNSSIFPNGCNPSFIALNQRFNANGLDDDVALVNFFVSDLKVNVHKSSLYGLGVHSSDIQSMANIFGCLENNLPFTYLVLKWLLIWRVSILGMRLFKRLQASFPNGKLNPYRWEIWRFLSSQSGLLLNVIKAIHGSNGLLDQPPPTCTGYSIWITIHKAVANLKSNGVDHLRRPRDGIEESQFQELSSLLSLVFLSSSRDCWSWTLNGHGDFSVLSAKEFPTRINLSNRGLDVPCVLCPNCRNAVESRNHLFFGCSMALDLFRLLGRWWNIDIINLIDPFSWESWFNGLWLNSLQKLALEASFFSTWWLMWKYRNAVVFSLKKPLK
ncbi:hypothetical protein Tco_0296290 [Tanacetum coccineum]